MVQGPGEGVGVGRVVPVEGEVAGGPGSRRGRGWDLQYWCTPARRRNQPELRHCKTSHTSEFPFH